MVVISAAEKSVIVKIKSATVCDFCVVRIISILRDGGASEEEEVFGGASFFELVIIIFFFVQNYLNLLFLVQFIKKKGLIVFSKSNIYLLSKRSFE